MYMKNYLKIDEWSVIEEGFAPDKNRFVESIMSLGNGHMGLRGNFEEGYSGDSLQGSYLAGVYYPEPTVVGWWKIGYPEYYARVINATNFIGIGVKINGERLDLARTEAGNFKRVLNMYHGYLEREFSVFIGDKDCGNKKNIAKRKEFQVSIRRFLSVADPELAVIYCSITPINTPGNIELIPLLDGRIRNTDTARGESYWEEVAGSAEECRAYLHMKTRKTGFNAVTAMTYDLNHAPEKIEITEAGKYVDNRVSFKVESGESLILNKYIAVTTSRDYQEEEVLSCAVKKAKVAADRGFSNLFTEHKRVWERRWQENDIIIKGDSAAQQGIRFNIFQLYQTYTGEDSRLNIGPKGFTGEKYGGATYWDTEAYCLPFYLSTAREKVARNLLVYRYRHLEKAIENAEKLGFGDGAALYPMVTMNGEECHNEWEITFQEIHRNGAIAFAIYNYVRYTGDKSYLIDFGLEPLIAIARFWAQRVNYSQVKNKYVMLGVTGPNEYENNINNNWYTNFIATWCLEYADEVASYVKQVDSNKYKALVQKLSFNEEKELAQWREIRENMFFPVDEKLGIFLQQEGYMDKEQILVEDLDPKHRPINQKWSWDRILRSCFIKQADVLQGLYFHEDKFDIDTIRRNFEFYEPRTVHES